MSSERAELKVYLSKLQHSELKAFCATLGVSMSRFVDNAIREKIKREIERRKNERNIKQNK